ncbi:hypothetical protein ACVDG5_021390 [Mesorhizobium sp. ORM6]
MAVADDLVQLIVGKLEEAFCFAISRRQGKGACAQMAPDVAFFGQAFEFR